MITPAAVKAILNEMKATIPGIKTSELVVNESQLANFVKELSEEDNNILLGIIPEAAMVGDQDSLKWNNALLFFIFKKTSSRDVTHNDFIDIFNETLNCANQLVEILLAEKSGDNGDFCGIANELVEDSIDVQPVWNYFGCNGYLVKISLLTNV